MMSTFVRKYKIPVFLKYSATSRILKVLLLYILAISWYYQHTRLFIFLTKTCVHFGYVVFMTFCNPLITWSENQCIIIFFLNVTVQKLPFFIQCFINRYCFSLTFKFTQVWQKAALQAGSYAIWTCTPCFTPLLSGTRCSMLTLYFSPLRLGRIYFFKEPLFFQKHIVFRNQPLYTECSHWYQMSYIF